MTPSARIAAAIDILDSVVDAARGEGAPADRIVAEWARAHRFAGSKDRRAIRELVYDAIRHCGPIPASGRAAMLALAEQRPELAPLFDGSQYGPAVRGEGEPVATPGIAPEWLMAELANSGVDDEEAAALMDRAPLDLRVNTLKADRDTIEWRERGEPLAAPQGLRFASGTMVEQWPAYRDGLVEIQDHGSQLACAAVAARPGETVIDLCAGAGGKTLALAAAMDNSGTLLACDTDKRRLGNLSPRAARAGAGLIETMLLDPGRELEALRPWHARADAVLIDAPCSGTGTWRRKPEAKWRLTPQRLAQFGNVQDRLLDIAASLVRPGGRLVFVTCSLLDAEGSDRFAAFLERNPAWVCERPDLPLGRSRGEGIRLSPARDYTDGFFIARALMPC
ncbi:RsmB/NOP family class I SAM-dependent RNA methyltransferase [Erythrobacter sp. LQ02-29]|uniref:RsmB/NOP family class I SAM-dependent RNA methyltransferase n=1 Tax=Erythrobacter sp. LQ02-29 TaxID=2920384 RepID=UPI001F4E5E67|nr:RsmB/NOP family class I SAM-dependent RNA methyltransferase [Erythrobacter sp. LQ02-29]MCP9223030.1 RsmB/NOP family class I SAM-dependent RNA methyltransferase [Erythrobacter sp. LQ02-29]